jgi:hypothetical protein
VLYTVLKLVSLCHKKVDQRFLLLSTKNKKQVLKLLQEGVYCINIGGQLLVDPHTLATLSRTSLLKNISYAFKGLKFLGSSPDVRLLKTGATRHVALTRVLEGGDHTCATTVLSKGRYGIQLTQGANTSGEVFYQKGSPSLIKTGQFRVSQEATERYGPMAQQIEDAIAYKIISDGCVEMRVQGFTSQTPRDELLGSPHLTTYLRAITETKLLKYEGLIAEFAKDPKAFKALSDNKLTILSQELDINYTQDILDHFDFK